MKGEERPLLAPEIVMIAPRSRFWWCARAWLIAAGFAVVLPTIAAESPADNAQAGIDAEKFFGAIVKVQAKALPDARSATTLGAEREGTGVVIDRDGLILTIGYLVVEADEVKISDDRGHTLPAMVVGYDHASGLALVRSVAPFDAAPLRLGDSAALAESDPVLVVNYGGRSGVTLGAWASPPMKYRAGFWLRAYRPRARPIRRECMSATSSSASAETPCIRRRSSIARCGDAAPQAAKSRSASCRTMMCAKSISPRSTASITSAGSRRFDRCLVVTRDERSAGY